jgi:hypothetical protein
MLENIRHTGPLLAARALVCAVLLFGAGCATTAGSSSAAAMKIAESESSLDAARHDCVQNAAELKKAELKLVKARAALAVQNYCDAAWLAEEAKADINFARTMTALEQAEQSADQLQRSNARLKRALENAKSN